LQLQATQNLICLHQITKLSTWSLEAKKSGVFMLLMLTQVDEMLNFL
jgi:hypothetical protein